MSFLCEYRVADTLISFFWHHKDRFFLEERCFLYDDIKEIL